MRLTPQQHQQLMRHKAMTSISHHVHTAPPGYCSTYYCCYLIYRYRYKKRKVARFLWLAVYIMYLFKDAQINDIHLSINQSIKTDLYSAVCGKRISGARWQGLGGVSSVKQFRL